MAQFTNATARSVARSRSARGRVVSQVLRCLSFIAAGCARDGDGRVLPTPDRSEWGSRGEPRAAPPPGALPRAGADSALHPEPAAYPLDALPRKIGNGPIRCPDVSVREFTGDAIRFTPPARVIEPFREHLARLERIVGELSLRYYSRAPSSILVAASYDCRPVSGKSLISEHAFANAIDITGFQFPAAPVVREDGSIRPVAIPGPFEVRIDRHWHAHGDAVLERHARFLTELTKELIARGVFRTLLGPAHPDHADHFHFDMAPSNYVDL